mgnify:CR=1 FL=1
MHLAKGVGFGQLVRQLVSLTAVGEVVQLAKNRTWAISLDE